jgi:malate dehydrogenase
VPSIGLIGSGNVGSAFLLEAARRNWPVAIQVASRRREAATASILDALSAFPKTCTEFAAVERIEDGTDVVVVAVGLQHQPHLSNEALLERNVSIALERTSHLVSERTTFIVVGSPVDQVSEWFVRERVDLGPSRVVGFGGELDRARLDGALTARGIAEPGIVVGEHGRRTIPVYRSEAHYESVSEEVRAVLLEIRAGTPKARNLASGVHLANLLDSMLAEGQQTHCVSTFDAETGLFLTWPCRIGIRGVIRKEDVTMGERARLQLSDLLSSRRSSKRQVLHWIGDRR